MFSPRFVLALLATIPMVVVAADDISVNGVHVAPWRTDLLVKQAQTQGAKDSPELRNQVREQLIAGELLYQAAQAKGVGKNVDVQHAQEVARHQIMTNMLIGEYLKSNPVPEAEIKALFAEISKANSKEFKLRHILVANEADAKAVIDELKKGGKFADLAKKKSIDPGSKDKGGDLGWATPDKFVPEFSTAVMQLTKGQYSQTPVKTRFGFHVILMDDSRAAKKVPYEQAKPQLTRGLQQRQVQQFVQGIMSKAAPVNIPEWRTELRLKEASRQGAKDSPELRAQIKQQLTTDEVVYQAAQAKGLDKNTDVKQALELMQQQIVTSAYLDEYLKANPVTDAEIKKEYDAAVAAQPANASKLPPLQQVRPQILQHLQQQQVQKLVVELRGKAKVQ